MSHEFVGGILFGCGVSAAAFLIIQVLVMGRIYQRFAWIVKIADQLKEDQGHQRGWSGCPECQMRQVFDSESG